MSQKIRTKQQYNLALKVRKNLLDKIGEYNKVRNMLAGDKIHAPAIDGWISDLKGMLIPVDREIAEYLDNLANPVSDKPLTLADAFDQHFKGQVERRRQEGERNRFRATGTDVDVNEVW